MSAWSDDAASPRHDLDEDPSALDFSLEAMHGRVLRAQSKDLGAIGGGTAPASLGYRVVRWEDRGEGFGASEAGALLDVSPYESRDGLIYRKAHRIRTESKPVMRIGQFLEHGILALYAHESGEDVEAWVGEDGKPQTLASLAQPLMIASPDARVRDTRRGIEIKFSGGGRGWGTGDVLSDLPAYTIHDGRAAPLMYQLQAQQCMAVTGFDEWPIVGLIRGRLRVYAVERHEGAIARLHEEIPRAWDEVLRLRSAVAREE